MADIIKKLKWSHRVACSKLHCHINVLKHLLQPLPLPLQLLLPLLPLPLPLPLKSQLPSYCHCHCCLTSGFASPRSTMRTASNKKGTKSLPPRKIPIQKRLNNTRIENWLLAPTGALSFFLSAMVHHYKTQVFRIKKKNLLTMNPGVSLQGTTVFPSDTPQSETAWKVSLRFLA